MGPSLPSWGWGWGGIEVEVVGESNRLHRLEVPSFSLARAILSRPDPHSRSYLLQKGKKVVSKSYNSHRPKHWPAAALPRQGATI